MDKDTRDLLEEIHAWMKKLETEDGHDYVDGWIELLPKVEKVLSNG